MDRSHPRPAEQVGAPALPRTAPQPERAGNPAARAVAIPEPAGPVSVISLYHSPEDTGADLRQVDAAVRAMARTPGMIDIDAEPGAVTWYIDRPLEECAPLALAAVAGLARTWWSFSLRTMSPEAFVAIREYRAANPIGEHGKTLRKP
jgi:hypothetical protein